MYEPKTRSLKYPASGGESDALSGAEEPAEFDLAPPETNSGRIKESSDEYAPPVGYKPTVPVRDAIGNPANPSANQDKPLDLAPAVEGQNELQVIKAGVERLEQNIKAIAESSGKTADTVREMHKLYHTEFANRLKSMQDELERYREMEKGRAFDGILGGVAKLYSEYEPVIDETDEMPDDKLKKRIRYMFMDILQLLEENNVLKQKSDPGVKRNTRHCQVIERVPTNDPALHDTVIQSRSTGFYIENRSLIKERVDIYLFADTAANNPAKD
ncbi:MAG: nucleotide exchange factor GrpE [Holophagales bacterium]|jgi:hypothetical protein|nr:nucleotide exchange factor GrpE [Holophagales bacterium]